MKAKISRMIGKSFLVSGDVMLIQNITEAPAVDGETIYSVDFSNGHDVKYSEEELLSDFKPVASEAIITANAHMAKSASKSFDSMDQLSDVLMDTIKKVQQSPEYVPQANAINNAAKGLVEINKTKIEAMKLVHEMSK